MSVVLLRTSKLFHRREMTRSKPRQDTAKLTGDFYNKIGQKQTTHAAKSKLLDHFVGPAKQRQWDGEAQ